MFWFSYNLPMIELQFLHVLNLFWLPSCLMQLRGPNHFCDCMLCFFVTWSPHFALSWLRASSSKYVWMASSDLNFLSLHLFITLTFASALQMSSGKFSLLSLVHTKELYWNVKVLVSRLWEYRGATDDGPLVHTGIVVLDQEVCFDLCHLCLHCCCWPLALITDVDM